MASKAQRGISSSSIRQPHMLLWVLTVASKMGLNGQKPPLIPAGPGRNSISSLPLHNNAAPLSVKNYKEVPMPNRMEEILAHKRSEVGDLIKKGLPTHRVHDLPPLRDFKAAVSRPGRIRLIAEIKFASPSAGVIREKMDPCAIGRVYEEAGAAALSLLTDSRFFGGSLKELP